MLERANRIMKKSTGFYLSRDRPWAEGFAGIIESVAPYTMTSEARIVALCEAVDHVVDRQLDGAIVECGVWRGGSMMAAALRLQERAEVRDMWLYDTFEGMPEPDGDRDGQKAVEKWRQGRGRGAGSEWCFADVDDVQANMLKTGYPASRMTYVAGKVEDTIPAQAPEQIALLRLDTDFYYSTRHELDHLGSRMVNGGILILDDYGHWVGARRAVDEWLDGVTPPLFLHRIDYTGRLAVIRR